MDRLRLRRILRDTAPVAAGYIVLGTGFGIVMRAAGYTALMAVSMSLLIYAGSMQYAAVSLFTGGAGLLTVALTTLLVNARHFFYGISMTEKYKEAKLVKPYLIFGLTDETYSLLVNGEHEIRYCFLVTLFDHFYWVAGTALGAVLGEVIRFSTEGIDFSLTALFLTVFTEQWLGTKKHLPALCGVLASVFSLLVFGKSDFLIPAMLLIAGSLILYDRKEGACD